MMSEIFLKLFNMSITASWLILAVVLLRFVLKKAPSWINCLLWGLVGLRLVMPFSLESIFSLVPSAEIIPQSNMSSTEAPLIDSGFASVNQTVNPIITETYVEHGNQLPSLLTIFSVIWLGGIAAMLIYGVISYALLYRKVRISILHKENLYFCDNVDTPFILGIIKPKIYLPSGISEEQLEYVIKHEKAHLKRKDHWWKPLGFALLAVYWFNPVIWVAYILLCRDIEHACDEKVIRDMDNTDKKGYLETLVNCSTLRRKIMICPLAFGEVSVKRRIKSMLNYKKPAFWVIVVGIIACAVVAVCFLTNPAKDKEEETTTKPTTQSEESTSAPTTTEPISEEASTGEATEEKEKTEEAENTTEKAGKDETTTKKPDKTNTSNENKGTNSKITYTTDDSILLNINDNMVFGPQDAYVMVSNPKLNEHYYFNRSVIKAYSVPKYFDSSTEDAENMNKAIELQKELVWINKKVKELGINVGSVTSGGGPGIDTTEGILYTTLAHYNAKEDAIIQALVGNGTLKISESERNKVIRYGCSSHSSIYFTYPEDLPQEVADAEIEFIRSLFGSDGINSYEELEKASKLLSEREEEVNKNLPSYKRARMSAEYYQDEWYEPGLGVDESKYNVVTESQNTAHGEKSFFIKINYDPVEHLNLDEANEEEVLLESARAKYIAYKKKEIDKLSVTLNKERYINMAKKYR